MHARLLTAERRNRLMGAPANCHCCNYQSENLMHVMRDCGIAWELWRELQGGRIDPEFGNLQGIDWFNWNLSRKEGE